MKNYKLCGVGVEGTHKQLLYSNVMYVNEMLEKTMQIVCKLKL